MFDFQYFGFSPFKQVGAWSSDVNSTSVLCCFQRIMIHFASQPILVVAYLH